MTNGQNKLIDFKRILIIRMSAFGDIILTTPLIRALKKAYPEAKIDFLTKKQFEPLLIYNPHLERVIGFDTEQGFWGLLKLIRSLKKEKYDFISRFFAPKVGINEDPVTGSAHCLLGPYWAPKLNKQEFLAFQASARSGEVRVRLQGERVFVGGKAITVLQGKLVHQ